MQSQETAPGGRKSAVILVGAAGIALAAAVATMSMTPNHRSTDVKAASTDDVMDAVGRLSPNCRMIATRRLKSRLDNGSHAALTDSDVDDVLAPLRRGGSEMCDEAIGQRFALGGS